MVEFVQCLGYSDFIFPVIITGVVSFVSGVLVCTAVCVVVALRT